MGVERKKAVDWGLRTAAVLALSGCANLADQSPTPTRVPEPKRTATIAPPTVTVTPTLTLTPQVGIEIGGGGIFTEAEATAIAQAQEETGKKIGELEKEVLEKFGKSVDLVADIDVYINPETNKASTSIVYREDNNGSGEATIYTRDSQGELVEIKAEKNEDFKPCFDEKGNPWTCLVNEEGLIIGYVYEGTLVRKSKPLKPEGLPIVLSPDYFVKPTPEPTPTPESALIPQIKDYDFFWGFKKGEFGLVLGDLSPGGHDYFVYYIRRYKDGSSGFSFFQSTVIETEDGYSQRVMKYGIQFVNIIPLEGQDKLKVKIVGYEFEGELVLERRGRGKEVLEAIGKIFVGATGTPRSKEKIIRDLERANIDYSRLP